MKELEDLGNTLGKRRKGRLRGVLSVSHTPRTKPCSLETEQGIK